jgi:hypothetical protein
MDREAQARQVVVRLVDEQEAAVQRAVARGWLPTEQDAKEVWDSLNAAFDVLEALVWRVEGISEADESSELPRPVTFEDIGVVSVIAANAKERAEEIREFAERLGKCVSALEAIRISSASTAT